MASLFRNLTERFRRGQVGNFIRNAPSEPESDEQEMDNINEQSIAELSRLQALLDAPERQLRAQGNHYRNLTVHRAQDSPDLEDFHRQIAHMYDMPTIQTSEDDMELHELHDRAWYESYAASYEPSPWEDRTTFRNRVGVNMNQRMALRHPEWHVGTHRRGTPNWESISGNEIYGHSIRESDLSESVINYLGTIDTPNVLRDNTMDAPNFVTSNRLHGFSSYERMWSPSIDREHELRNEQFRISKNDVILLTSDLMNATANVKEDMIVEFVKLKDSHPRYSFTTETPWAYGRTITSSDKLEYGPVILFDLSTAKQLSINNTKRLERPEVAPANPKLPEI